jgi:hypothetical protein
MKNKIASYFLSFIWCSFFYAFIGACPTAVKHRQYSSYYLGTVIVNLYSDFVNVHGAFWQPELTCSKHCWPITKDQINASRDIVCVAFQCL